MRILFIILFSTLFSTLYAQQVTLECYSNDTLDVADCTICTNPVDREIFTGLIIQFIYPTDTIRRKIHYPYRIKERAGDVLFYDNMSHNALFKIDSTQFDFSSLINWLKTCHFPDSQSLSIVNDTLYISRGNFVSLVPYLAGTDTDSQSLSFIAPDTIQISRGNKIHIPGLAGGSYYWQVNGVDDAFGATTINTTDIVSFDGTNGLTAALAAGGSKTVLVDGALLQWYVAGNTGTPALIGDAGSQETVSILGATGLTTAISTNTLTITPANDLGALEGLSGTGFPVRTAAETFALRTITAGTGISITNGDGVSGNPVISNTGMINWLLDNADDVAGAETITNGETVSFAGLNGIVISPIVGNTIEIDGWLLRWRVVGSSGTPFTIGDGVSVEDVNFIGTGTVSTTADNTINRLTIHGTPQTLTYTGAAGGPVTLDISATASDVTFTAGTDITFNRVGTNLTINAQEYDLSTSGTFITTLIGSGTSLQLLEGTGIDLTFGGTSANATITIATTVVDTDTDDQGLTYTGAAGGPVTIDIDGGSDVVLTAGTNITFNRVGSDLTINATGGSGSTDLTFTEASSPYTLNSSSGTDVTFSQAGIVTITRVSNNLEISATEADADPANEIQTLNNTGTGEILSTLSLSGGSLNIKAGTGITVTRTGTALNGIATIATTVVDTDTDDQGLTYTGAAGGPVTLDIDGGSDVTLTAGTNVTFNRVGTDLTINSASWVGGSGTVEYLPKWATSTTLNNSIVRHETTNGFIIIEQVYPNFALVLDGINYTGIRFDDEAGTGLIGYNNGTFTVGCGSCHTSITGTKALFVAGGVVIGENEVASSAPTNGLRVEGDIVALSPIYVTDILYDKNNEAGTSQQYLSSTVDGVDWLTLPDGSSSNEVQTFTHTGTGEMLSTLSISGGSINIKAGTGITVTRTGTALDGIATIATTVVDTDTDDQGLTYTGAAGGPVTIDIDNGSDVTITAGTNVSFNRVGTDLTINTTAGGANLVFTGSVNPNLTWVNDGGTDVTLVAGAGLSYTSISTSSATITAVDQSASNELQTLASTGTGEILVTLSDAGGSLNIKAGAGITVTRTGTALDGIATIATTIVDTDTDDQGLTYTGAAGGPVTLDIDNGGDVTITAGTNITFNRVGADLTINASGGATTDLTFTEASSPYTLNSSTGTDVTFSQAGIITITRVSNNLEISATEADADPANEIQTLNNTGTGEILSTLSLSGGSLNIKAGAGITVTRTGTALNGIATIATTVVDTDTDDQGLTYTGGAGGPVTLDIDGGSDVTITAGTNVTFNRVGTDLTINSASWVGGSGTVEYLPKWATSTTLNNSIVRHETTNGFIIIEQVYPNFALVLDGINYTGIRFDDEAGTSLIGYNNGTFTIGCGSCHTSITGTKTLFVAGGVVIGENEAASSAPTNGLRVEGDIVAISPVYITDILYDKNNQAGTSQQYLSSTVDGVDWLTLPDGSSSNEIQIFTHTGTGEILSTLSLSGGSINIKAGTGITVTRTGTALDGIATIASTVVDTDTDNYADAFSYTVGTGAAVIGRTGALPDLTATIRDYDFYEVGGTNSPDNIGDNKYTNGYLGLNPEAGALSHILDISGDGSATNLVQIRHANTEAGGVEIIYGLTGYQYRMITTGGSGVDGAVYLDANNTDGRIQLLYDGAVNVFLSANGSSLFRNALMVAEIGYSDASGRDFVISPARDMFLGGLLADKDNQAGTSGQVLSSTGTNVDWITVDGSSTNEVQTLTYSGAAGGPVTLDISLSASDVTLTAGTNVTFSRVGTDLTINATAGSTFPGGSDTHVQFNNAGSFGGNSGFVYNGSGNVGINASPSQRFHVGGNVRITGALYDGNNEPGSATQYLSTNGTTLDWVALPDNSASNEYQTLSHNTSNNQLTITPSGNTISSLEWNFYTSSSLVSASPSDNVLRVGKTTLGWAGSVSTDIETEAQLRVFQDSKIDNITYTTIRPSFGQRRIVLADMVNGLWLSGTRYSVTKNGSSYTSDLMFDNNFETGVSPDASAWSIIVDLTAGGAALPASGVTYPQGYVFVSFYDNLYTHDSLRVYARYQDGTQSEITSTKTDISTAANFRVFRYSVSDKNYLTKVRVDVRNGNGGATSITEIQLYSNRANAEVKPPYFSMTETNTVWQALIMRSSFYALAGVFDKDGQSGSSGQVLSSTGSQVDWITLPSNLVGGTGTTDFVTKWTSSTTIGNSTIRDNGSTVSIGAAPDASYELFIADGNIKFGDATSEMNKLYFGDGTFVYVGENIADDRLYLRGSTLSIDINGNLGTNGYVLTSNGTTASWAATGISGTIDYVPKFTAANTIGNSKIIDKGTNGAILIGTTSDSDPTGFSGIPSALKSVQYGMTHFFQTFTTGSPSYGGIGAFSAAGGKAYLGLSSDGVTVYAGALNSAEFQLVAGNSIWVTIETDGKTGIATTGATQRLHVADPDGGGAATGNIRVEGAYYDSQNDAGNIFEVLGTSTSGTKTDWVMGSWTMTLTSGHIASGVTISDNHTMYFGQTIWDMQQAYSQVISPHEKVYAPQAGTLYRVGCTCAHDNASSGETWTWYVRKNDTTDYTIGSTTSTATTKTINSTGNLGITMLTTDYLTIKIVNPTWTTNPQGISIICTLFFYTS